MRRWVLIAIVAVVCAPWLFPPMHFFASSDEHRKVYRVAIVPICNPGTHCDPRLPARLASVFFEHPAGVASFIAAASNGRAEVRGHTAPWLRPRFRIKNLESAEDMRPELM